MTNSQPSGSHAQPAHLPPAQVPPSAPADELEIIEDDAQARSKALADWNANAAADEDVLGLGAPQTKSSDGLFEDTVKVQRPAPAAIPSWQQLPTPAPAQSSAIGTVDDITIRGEDLPGTRADLWNCPHCETRNKPERTHCRQCGKSPRQPKEQPWWSRPEALVGGISALVLLAIIVLWALRTDVSLKPPTAASVDRAVRLGSTVPVKREFAGGTFEAKGALAVCGRILAARQTPGTRGVTSVVLALGGDAREPAFTGTKVIWAEGGIQTAAGHAVLIHLVTDLQLDLSTGAYLSVTGDYGTVNDHGFLVPALNEAGSYTVYPAQISQ